MTVEGALRVDFDRGLIDAVEKATAIRAIPRLSSSFGAAMQELHAARYTGRVVLHFAEGKPKALELPSPIAVQLKDA